jgi:post-segregation antitoxin (ccd killing protein)
MKIFDRVQINKPKKSAFDLSHERKFSMNMGDLVPVLCQEVLPGDSFRLNMEQLVRLQPMLAPMMHRVNVYTHFFFVPNRLIWSEWEKFITGGDTGTNMPVFPIFTNSKTADELKSSPYFNYGSLVDYLGIPVKQIKSSSLTTQVPKLEFSQLPFRAYHLIYNEYYRDQNLESEISVPKSSGAQTWPTISNLLILRKRAWEKDYFTSALPYAQKGQALELPLTGDAPIYMELGAQGKLDVIGQTTTGQMAVDVRVDENAATTSATQLKADMSSVNSATINELRSAFQIQKWLEKNARGGTRYIEQILSHFGVKSSDARLQRPEYLGGGKTPVTVSEVLQMSATEATSPQGNMAGHGLSVGSSHSFKRYFEEHGFIIGIMSVLPRTAYFQGLPKMFSRTDRFDYAWPEFAHLGEQEVKNQELYLDLSDDAYNNGTFGYQPRYTEYRYIPDTVHGDFADSLKFWHMAREFSTRPALNSSFVKSDPTTRVFAVTDPAYPKLLVQTYANLQAIRTLPKYGNPGGI